MVIRNWKVDLDEVFCLLNWYWNFEKELHKVRLNKFSKSHWNHLIEFRMNRSYTALPGTSGSRQPSYSVSRINWGRQPNNLVLKFANTFWTKCSCKKIMCKDFANFKFVKLLFPKYCLILDNDLSNWWLLRNCYWRRLLCRSKYLKSNS